MATVWLDRYECDREERLPPVCMKCGADAEHYVKRTFSWYPPWVVVLILVALLVYIIVAIILTKKMPVYVPLCDEHKGYFKKRALIGGLLMLAGFALLAGGITGAVVLSGPPGGDDAAMVCGLGGAFAFFVLLIAGAIVMQAGIKPTEITDDDIRLTNVSEEFVDALRDQRRDEKERRALRRRERDTEEDVEDDPRRRPRDA